MQLIALLGPMYQAGTLSGNLLVMSAGIAALSLIRGEEYWRKLEQVAAKLEAGVSSASKQAGILIQQMRVGTMFTTFFKFFQKMLENGVYLAPSQFEAGFISTLHTDEIIERTIEAVAESFRTW